jgi:alpha-L-arabinofuranosidase
VTSGGSKSGQIPETVRSLSIDANKTYEIKIVVKDNSILCYLNGSLMITYVVPTVESLYQVASQDEKGDLILKIVNVSKQPQDIHILLNNITLASDTATLTQLCATNKATMNTITDPQAITPVTSTFTLSPTSDYTAPPYSVTILRASTTP